MPHSNVCSEVCRAKPVGRAVGDVGTATSKAVKDVGASAGKLVGSLLDTPEPSPEIMNAYGRTIDDHIAERGIILGTLTAFVKLMAPVVFILMTTVIGCVGVSGWFGVFIMLAGLVVGIVWIFRTLVT
jgi:hypothetical protein